MNQDNFPAIPSVFLILLMILFGIIYAGFKAGHIKAVPEPPKFSVVDTYKGCSVVRYAPPGDAKFHYFLDCSSLK